MYKACYKTHKPKIPNEQTLSLCIKKVKRMNKVGAKDKQAPVNFVMAGKYLRVLPTKQNSIWNTETQTHVYKLATKKNKTKTKNVTQRKRTGHTTIKYRQHDIFIARHNSSQNKRTVQQNNFKTTLFSKIISQHTHK